MKVIKIIIIAALIAAIATAAYVLFKEDQKAAQPEPVIEQTAETPEQEPPDMPED